jgi:hypothetical protein
MFGVDLSSGTVALVKKDYPAMPFQAGSIRALAVENGTVGSITPWYSMVRTPPAQLPATIDEF